MLLIGNLTRDPELRYTPTGAAVCTLGLATNRYWTTESGEKKEDVEFHRVVAWNKLAELCSQLLTKGRKIYVEGRLQTRTWQAADGAQRTTTEVVIEDMILLDFKRPATLSGEEAGSETPSETKAASVRQDSEQALRPASAGSEQAKSIAQPTIGKKTEGTEDVNPDDIPF